MRLRELPTARTQNPDRTGQEEEGRVQFIITTSSPQLPLGTAQRELGAQITGSTASSSLPRSNPDKSGRAPLFSSLVLETLDGQLRQIDGRTDRLTDVLFVPFVLSLWASPLVSLVPCLVVSILETISLSLSAAIQPIRSDQQSSTERSTEREREGTRLEVTQSRPHVHCHGSLGSIHSWAGLSGGHGYSRNSTRSGSIAHIDSISPPTATHTSSHLVFPFVVAAAFFLL